MSGNQTSGKEGGVQYVLTAVCMYVCLISYMSDSEETQAWPSSVGQLSSLMLPELPSFSVVKISLTKRLTKLLTKQPLASIVRFVSGCSVV